MSEPIVDLSALAWVHDELRRSLETAHKALRRHLKEADALGESDVDVVDPGLLRGARVQLHQGLGALELVGLSAAANVLRASEAAVARCAAKPALLTGPVVEDVERASFALLDFLSRMLAGKPVSALSMFPQYRAVQEAAGADRAHPADLWSVDWRWIELPASHVAAPRKTNAESRVLLETELLKLMRGQKPRISAARMSEVCAGLGAGAKDRLQEATLWKLAAAVFEAQARELLPMDVYSQRVASRLLAQFRVLEKGQGEVSDRLAQDLLFFCAQSAPGDGHKAPRLTAVQHAYGLKSHVPVDYSRSALGQFDPAWVAQARKRVAAAKESWQAVAGGDMHRLSGLTEQFTLVSDSLKRLFPQGEAFGAELLRAVGQCQAGGVAPSAPVAMEVATSLLYVDAVLEDAEFNHPGQSERVHRLAERLAAVRSGQPPDALEGWMEELYRRVADRQTMGSVVQELRASLAEAEKAIDEFFRVPAEPKPLLGVPKHLAAMRGVLSVLGMDHAAAALLRMRDDVDGLASTAIDPARVAQAGVFDRIASNLGALGFLIDMLSVQPQMAKSLFTFDAQAGTLKPVMGRAGDAAEDGAAAGPTPTVEPRLIEQAQHLAVAALHDHVPVADVARDLERLSHEASAADQQGLAQTMRQAQTALGQARTEADVDSARGKLSEALIDFVSSVSDSSAMEPELAALREAPVAPAAPAPKARANLSEDDELREIFLEEAREVIDQAEEARKGLIEDPADLSQLTAVRRAFHTLKGSSRMVGLKDFGDAAWTCERLFNSQLAEQLPADDALIEFTQWAFDYLGGWIDDIAAHRLGGHSAATVDTAVKLLSERRNDSGALQAASDIDLPLASQPPSTIPSVFGQSEFAGVESESASLTADAPEAIALEDLLSRQAEAPSFPRLEAPPVPPLVPPLIPQATDAPPAPPVEPEPAPVAAELPVLTSEVAEPENVKIVGPLRIGIPLFNIYLNEADELSRRLTTEVAEWAMELHRPVDESTIALAHSLAGSSATVGFSDLSELARTLEHALARSAAIGQGHAEEARLFVDTAEEIRRMLHQFAAGFLVAPAPSLLARLDAHEIESARRLEAFTAAADMPASTRSGELARMHLHPLIDLQITELSPPAVEAPVGDRGAVERRASETNFDALQTSFESSGFVELKTLAEMPAHGPRSAPLKHDQVDIDEDIDAVDAVDAELFPIFEEEALELLPQLASQLREWQQHPSQPEHASACMRTLHTLKGGARLAGAMRLGEMAHRLETRIEPLAGEGGAALSDVESLQSACDTLVQFFDAMRQQDAQAHANAVASLVDLPPASPPVAAPAAPFAQASSAMPLATDPSASPLPPTSVPVVPPEADAAQDAAPTTATGDLPDATTVPAAPPWSSAANEDGATADAEPATDLPAIDWSPFAANGPAARVAADRTPAATQTAVRVRAPLLDRLVNQAGEVSIARSRIETEVSQIKGSLTDLTENLERLRGQLRDIELQAETQMSSRLEAAKAADQSFDPLEFDRFTRFQEVTRMMAESVNDVATVQRTLQRSLESTEDELVAQARMTRELQDDLLRTRMVEFEGLSDRFYRVVRQAAKETGKQVRLDITGGAIEVDRGVLDRMTGTFEHLLRNCVTHGIELPGARTAAGKDPTGTITIMLTQEGNEVSVEVRDDGAGLNLKRIRAKGEAMGLIQPAQQYSDAELANLIFTPGFSTADAVTELAGRGVGMDVVRSEVNAIGGRVETATARDQGTSFKLALPLTTAVTQVVMLRCGDTTIAVPSSLIEIVRRITPGEMDAAHATGVFTLAERAMPLYWLGALLQLGSVSLETAPRTRAVVVVRSAQQRVALHVDEVLGNQEVVVKNLGPQLSRMPGLAGVTLLASGAVALIYNPVALATVYGAAARSATIAALRSPGTGAPPVAGETPRVAAPLVLVVDDSLTVRRVTQRMLVREGYRVSLAKDGMDALERLSEELPSVVLTDIEMPRMDGFDLVRNIRNDSRLKGMPVIVITSRIAQKHRDYATELGVDHYLGKPYSEDDLLALVGHYTSAGSAA